MTPSSRPSRVAALEDGGSDRWQLVLLDDAQRIVVHGLRVPVAAERDVRGVVARARCHDAVIVAGVALRLDERLLPPVEQPMKYERDGPTP
jgi:hypothetical protein